MLAELKALVVLAESGSMERAAHDLYLTPSAFTRRIQRLENELGVVLLDRRFKPPKLTRAGFEVLERGQAILSSVGDLKRSTSGDDQPSGPFRLGFAHSVAQSDMSKVVIELGRQFPLLQPNICNDVSSQLLARAHVGELDAVVVLMPGEMPLPYDLDGVTLAHDAIRIVQAGTAAKRKSSRYSEFYRRSWILNPAGCWVRDEIKNRVERLGAPLIVAAELHNPELQLSLIVGDVGVGLLRESLLRTHKLRKRLSVIKHPEFNMSVRIAFCRGRHLGTREEVALALQQLLLAHFESSKRAKNSHL